MANLIEQLIALVANGSPNNLPWPESEPVEEFQR